jgi:uncharacterized membrane protein YfcA
MSLLAGSVLGLAIGSVLGLIGAGGAILAVPGLVAVLGLSATAATTSSTIIVGAAALAGALRRRKSGNIDIKIGITFSTLGLIGTFAGTQLLNLIPENLLLILFAVLMFVSAYAMCCREINERTSTQKNWFSISLAATGVGLLTGLLGVGGGFLIVPALVILLKLPTKLAIGTSLVSITINSLVAFLLRFPYWDLIPVIEIALFTTAAIAASTLLSPLGAKLNTKVLQRMFSVVIVFVAIYLIATNTN